MSLQPIAEATLQSFNNLVYDPIGIIIRRKSLDKCSNRLSRGVDDQTDTHDYIIQQSFLQQTESRLKITPVIHGCFE
jgi:hypothetical protein